MDGLTLLSLLRRLHPKLPVVVFSTLTERGARATLDALARGASDYVCKPSGQRSILQTMEKIRDELIPKIHALHARARSGPAPGPAPIKPVQGGPSAPVQLIVIAISTGGPGALAEVIPKLPASLRAPVLIVQHMPPVFTKVLAQRLGQTSALKVKEAAHQDRITAGNVYIAPGDFHMRVSGGPREAWVTLDKTEPENGCRPAADPLFQSASQVFGAGVLGVVMTGLGRDATKGATLIYNAGGQIWAQDEASSTVWSMPGSVVHAGLAQRVLPLQSIARALSDVAASGPGGTGSAANSGSPKPPSQTTGSRKLP
jgi:two-component system chemotaxis response regulator CheB